jgi:hypothetical protein
VIKLVWSNDENDPDRGKLKYSDKHLSHWQFIDNFYIWGLQLGWHPVAAVQYTFTHKQYIEQHNLFTTNLTRIGFWSKSGLHVAGPAAKRLSHGTD